MRRFSILVLLGGLCGCEGAAVAPADGSGGSDAAGDDAAVQDGGSDGGTPAPDASGTPDTAVPPRDGSTPAPDAAIDSGSVTPGACTIHDTSGCVAGTELAFMDEQFVCDRPLASYGALPIRVVVDFTPGRPFRGNGAIDLTTGCAGDGDPETIDLIVDVRGDGVTFGPGVDAMKVRLRAGYDAGIQLTGHVDCGPRADPSVHADGVQLQGGRDIAFVDFSVGDYEGGRSTCQGAGGAFFYSSASGNVPENIDVIRGSYIACNHSLLAGSGTGDVVDARFRSGRVDGSDPVCAGFFGSPACSGDAPGVTLTDVTCERWNAAAGAFR